MKGTEKSGRRALLLIEGGAASVAGPRKAGRAHAARPPRSAVRSDAGLAEDLSDPVRETERRIGLLLAGDYGPLRDPQREELRAVSEAAELVSAVVSLLGILEREDAGSGEPEELFDVRFALWDVVEEHTARARLKRVRLDLSLPDSPLLVRCPRSCARAVLRFALREHLHLVSPGDRITLRGDREEGGPLVRIERRRAGRGPERSSHRTAQALTRILLERHGGGLFLSPDGREWRMRLPGAARESEAPRSDQGI